jgi:hypothetical protein
MQPTGRNGRDLPLGRGAAGARCGTQVCAGAGMIAPQLMRKSLGVPPYAPSLSDRHADLIELDAGNAVLGNSCRPNASSLG